MKSLKVQIEYNLRAQKPEVIEKKTPNLLFFKKSHDCLGLIHDIWVGNTATLVYNHQFLKFNHIKGISMG